MRADEGACAASSSRSPTPTSRCSSTGESGVRQGDRGAHRPRRALNAQATRPLREGQLRGAARGPARERALRLREGSLHGRGSARKYGKFELAHKGTIFLDEIGEMSPGLQAKLLQVLQDSEFTRLGGNKEVKVDVRVITATNRPPRRDGRAANTFREDLYFRLNVVSVELPPLRERREEMEVADRQLPAPLLRALRQAHPARALGSGLMELLPPTTPSRATSASSRT